MKLAALVPIVFAFAPTIAAQQPPPSCTAAEYRQFDFWLGDWTVTDSAGTKEYGANLITQEEGTCLVHEHWTDGSGSTGQSFNFYEAVTGRWSQVWVASTGNVLRLSGRFDGHSMTLEGESGPPNGRRTLNRIVWTPQPDGRVRQVWSVSQDKGATWQSSFDGWYRRKT
jgi:hypothetical protein